MSRDNGQTMDLDEVRDIIERADVLTIGFTFTPERLLIDTRVDAEEGPLIALVAPVSDVRERYQWLGRHRGRFGLPQAFSFVAWPLSMRTFDQVDVLGPMRDRLAAIDPANVQPLEEALALVRLREREMTAAAIRGDAPWHTLWSRADSAVE